jgi:kynurenine formamidase
MHVDAPSHFLLAAQEFLNNVFPEQWIGKSGPTAWPAGSTD